MDTARSSGLCILSVFEPVLLISTCIFFSLALVTFYFHPEAFGEFSTEFLTEVIRDGGFSVS